MADNWITETGIPAFRPHVRRDDSGRVLYEVTARDLADIVRNSARVTIELHGSKPPITEGHRNFDAKAKEADQPLVLGYLENFRLGALPDGTPAILCDRKYMAQYADIAKRHPFASVDYLPTKKAIVGLAKLTRPPALNLGAVYYPGTNEPVYVYSMGANQVEPQANPSPDAGQQTPELTPEEIQGCEKVYAYLMKKYAWVAKCAEQFNQPAEGPGSPGPTNTKVPSDKDDDDKEKPDMSQANAALIQKYESTQAQLSTLIAEREKEKVERILDGLEKVERYQFDRPAEATRMLRLTEAERKVRADEIRKYHHKLPGGDRIDVYSGRVEGPEGETSNDLMKQAVKYATKHGVSYDDALAKLKSGK